MSNFKYPVMDENQIIAEQRREIERLEKELTVLKSYVRMMSVGMDALAPYVNALGVPGRTRDAFSASLAAAKKASGA